jgi:uncharacterized protein (DUF362 family)
VTPTVGIVQSGARTYSEAWRTEDEYAEKDQLRTVGRLLGYNDGNFLRGTVVPGQTVVVKPNWVLDQHPKGLEIFAVLTHSAVVRAVVDLVYEALEGAGSITIADAPQWNCDFQNLLRVTEVDAIANYYRARHGFDVRILDLRQMAAGVQAGWVKYSERVELPGDPLGYAVVDFGDESAFVGMPHIDRIYGADYDRSETLLHHNAEKHEYLVSRTILTADTIVHVPKLKVHKKVGVTLNSKGMVGINGHKNWLAHYRVGPPSEGGDQYPDGRPVRAQMRSRAYRLATELLGKQTKAREVMFDVLYGGYRLTKPLVRRILRPNENEVELEGGNWFGNDTAWRMTADLARAVLYADADGQIQSLPQRRFLSVVDGIIAGEEEGPLAATPKPCGVLLAGDNLLAVDLVGTRLMGFDWQKLKSLQWLVESSPQDAGVREDGTIKIVSNVDDWRALMEDSSAPDLAFAPHPAWVGHIELERSPATRAPSA